MALRRQAADLIEAGLADDEAGVALRADQLDALHREPERRANLWALGVDREFADESRRRTELSNFLAHLSGGAAG